MKTKTLFIATIVAAGCLQFAQTSFANDEQDIPGVPAQPDSYFFTGKPYDAELGGYVFAARVLDPTMNRWTTPDPSGFPDGPNNRIYAPVPTTQFDPTGLYAISNPYTGGDQYVQMSNIALNSYNIETNIVGKYVHNPDLNLSGQCATGAQFLCGTSNNGPLHDSPLTKTTWDEGVAVSGNNIQTGTMIALGWHDGKYPNNLSGNHVGLYISSTANQVTILDQFVIGAPTIALGGTCAGLNIRTYDISGWSVVTTTIAEDPSVSTSWLE